MSGVEKGQQVLAAKESAKAGPIRIAEVDVHATMGASTAYLDIRGELADASKTIAIGAPRVDFANRKVTIELSCVAPNAWRPGEAAGTFNRRVDLYSIAFKNGPTPWEIRLVDAGGNVLREVTLGDKRRIEGW
ncbi:MAG: hypothetical protein AAB426_02990 [Myxococcota bacterium]